MFSGYSYIVTIMCKEAVNAGKYIKDFWLRWSQLCVKKLSLKVNAEKITGYSKIATVLCKEAVNAGKYRKGFWQF